MAKDLETFHTLEKSSLSAITTSLQTREMMSHTTNNHILIRDE